jgi:Putative beta-lactamase-inhibitor-like, PepSY-like
LKPDGSIVCIEMQIDAKDLPKPVAEALAAKYPKATYKIVEKIAKGDAITYEVLLETAEKKKLEVVFDPKGKLLEEENKDKKP